MTDREKAIVMAYTGVTMLAGDKFQIFHKYIEDILGRPVWTHELAVELVWNEIKEKSKDDFLEICKTKEPQGEWIDEGQYAEGHSEHFYRCSECGGYIIALRVDDFCKHCGAEMRVKHELNRVKYEL